MENEKELWERLENETSRAFEAFQTFLSLPSSDRTLVGAYRRYVGNPNASKVSDAWNEWARRYAWKERARAYDAHIDRIRRNAMEEAIEEEAAEQARQAERARYHLNELLMNYHAKTMDFLEQMDPADMRFSDAVQVAKLFIEHVDKFGSGDADKQADEWTEDDDEFLNKAAERVRQRRMARDNGGADPGSRLRVYRELREVSRTKIKMTATTPRVLRNEPLKSHSARLATRRRTNQVTPGAL